MDKNKQKLVSASDLVHAIVQGESIRDIRVEEAVVIEDNKFEGRFDFENCSFAGFRAPMIQTPNLVRIEDCTFETFDCHAIYYFGGFSFKDSLVRGRFGIECGGHNNNGIFEIRDCRFEGFVDFEDCWFQGPVEIDNVDFVGGTNLLGNLKSPVCVSFDVPPKIKNTTGKLDIDTFHRN